MIWLIQTLLDTNIQLNPNTRHAQGLPVHYGFLTVKRTAVSLGCEKGRYRWRCWGMASALTCLPSRHNSVAEILSFVARKRFNYMHSHVCRWIFNYIVVIKWRLWSFNCAGYHFKPLILANFKEQVQISGVFVLLFFYCVIKCNECQAALEKLS